MKKNKDDIIMFIIILLISLIIFGPWIKGHYGIDTYDILEKQYDIYAINNSLKDGRIIMSGIMELAHFMELDIIMLVRITLILALIVSAITVIYLKNIILKYAKKETIITIVISSIIAYVIIFNFMYLDNLYFVECAVMALSLLMYLIASKILVEEKKGFWYKSTILVIIGMFCYQGTINFFITMTFVLSILKHRKLNKKVITNMLICALICGGAVILNLLQIKIIENVFDIKQVRIKGLNTMIRNIQYIFIKIPHVITNTTNLLPSYIFITFILILLIFSYLYYIRRNQKDIYIVGNIILICLVAYFSCFLINLLSLSSFATGRMTFSIGALIGILFMYIFLTMPIIQSKKIYYIFIAILLIYFTISITNYVQKINLEIKTNKEDMQIAKEIDKCIQEYEKSTGYSIKYIAFSTDSNCDKYIQNSTNPAMGNSAIYPTWSRVGLINYCTNRDLKEVKMNEEIYNKYFKEKDWNEFNEEQCVFIEDKMYYCIY